MTNRELERRLTNITAMVKEIHSALLSRGDMSAPGIEDYRRAVDAAALHGDRSKLDFYLARGGKIFDVTEAYPEAAVTGAQKRRQS